MSNIVLTYDRSNVSVEQEHLVEDLKAQAMQRAEWAYKDCMLAFQVVGVMPTKSQRDEILQDLAVSKLKSLLYKNNIRFS